MKSESQVKTNEVSGYGDAIAFLRSLPNGESIIAENFLYEDVDLALEQFCQSQEWHNTLTDLKVKPGMKVLDYGAGRCIASAAFAKEGCQVTSIDINSSEDVGLGLMRKSQTFDPYRDRIDAVVADGEYIPLASDTFDIVYCREVLHHAFDLRKLVTNLIHTLRPDGTFYAYGDHRRPWWSSDEQFRKWHPAVKYGVNEHSYLESEYVNVLRLAGFNDIKVIPIIPKRSMSWHHQLVHYAVQLPVLGIRLENMYDRLRHYRAIGSQIILVAKK